MSTRDDVKSGLLVYTCNCGWVDKNHALKTSTRPFVGAKNLWDQVKGETGVNSKNVGEKWFKVSYRQDMGATFLGRLRTTGV